MAAAFRSVSATTYGSRVNTTVTAPSGIQDGDVLVLVLVVGASGTAPPTPTLPSGFTALSGFPHLVSDAGDFRVNLWVATKVASGESGDYTVTHSSASTDALIACYSGGSGTVQATHNYQTYPTGTTATATATGLTTGADNSVVAFIAQNWDGYGAASPPAGSTPTFTERRDAGLIYLADGVLATAGATGDQSHNTNNSSSAYPWQAVLLEVRAFTASGPTIVSSPADTPVWPGANATFSVYATASGGGSLSYQWRDNSSGSFADISGATSATYTTAATDAAYGGRRYLCNVTETGGGSPGTVASASAVLTLKSAAPQRAYWAMLAEADPPIENTALRNVGAWH